MNVRPPGAVAVLAAALLLGPASPADAVLEENLESLSGDQTEGYLGPLAKGLSASLNSGIFRSGHVPKEGFGLTLDLKAAWISFSDDDRTYLTPETGAYESVEAPTVIGNTQSVGADHKTVPGLQFAYPGGFDLQNFGLAVPQLTIGNVAGTRAVIRYITLELGEEDLGDFELIGIGGQHSITQYVPDAPVDVAIGVLWQNFKIGNDLVDATAFAVHAIGSRSFGRTVTIEPFVGLGLDSFSMDAEYEDEAGDTISVSFDRENDVHFALGSSVNFPGVKLHAEFTVAAETGFAGGVSFGI